MLMMVWVVSALQRGDGQYASISPPTSSASSSKMESISAVLGWTGNDNYLFFHTIRRSGWVQSNSLPSNINHRLRQASVLPSVLGNGRIRRGAPALARERLD